jgi:TolB protein
MLVFSVLYKIQNIKNMQKMLINLCYIGVWWALPLFFRGISLANELMSINILKPCIVNRYKGRSELDILLNNNSNDESEDIVGDIIPDDIIDNITMREVVLYEEIKNKKHQKFVDDIYGRTIKNLKIIDLYKINYKYSFCNKINDFFEKNHIYDTSEYIFSGEFDNFDYVITTEVESLDNDEIKIQIFVWDILNRKFLDGKYYILHIESKEILLHKVSNLIADFIFQLTTGESAGLFDSKIIYVSETGGHSNREKQISLMNFDGSKNIVITDGKGLKFNPIFSKYNPDEIFYVQYLEEGPFVLMRNFKNNKITKISLPNLSMTVSPVFNPNGENQIIVSGTESSETNLILFDLNRKTNRLLTSGNNINTSASFNPNGNKVVYVSDKSGAQKLYINYLETDEDVLLYDYAGNYNKPVWSPDGKKIAFIKVSDKIFSIYVLTLETNEVEMLLNSYTLDGLKWSPNSRYIIYSKQGDIYGKESIPKLYIMDIVTKKEYKLNTPEKEGASDPDWIINF